MQARPRTLVVRLHMRLGRGNGGLEAAKHFGDGPLARIVEALLREQRTVNPAIAPSLQVPLLVLKAGPAARQPHDGHREPA